MSPKKNDLLWELTEHNHYFDMIAGMLPQARTSSSKSTSSQRESDAARVIDGGSRAEKALDPKKGKFHKEPGPESKDGRRAAAKAAKAAARAESNSKRRKLSDGAADEQNDTNEEMDTANEKSNGNLHSADTVADSGALPRSAEPGGGILPDTLPSGVSRIEALRAKLHAKLAALQKGDRPSPEQVSKRAARRAEKRRRQQEQQQQQKQQKSATTGASAMNYKLPAEGGTSSDNVDIAATIGFGRLTGIQQPGNGTSNYLDLNKSLANLNKPKNLHKMLADAEAKKAKLDALRKSGEASDLKQAAKMQWSDAMQEASGIRIRDDPSKIKKILKKKVAKKKKSEKAWKSRMEQVQKAHDDRQRQRTQNLQSRKHKGRGAVGGAVAPSKEDGNHRGPSASPSAPPGRRLSRPGFEGREQEFLNGGGSKK